MSNFMCVFGAAGDKSGGCVRALYDPTLSERGVLLCAARKPRAKDPLDFEVLTWLSKLLTLTLFHESLPTCSICFTVLYAVASCLEFLKRHIAVADTQPLRCQVKQVSPMLEAAPVALALPLCLPQSSFDICIA